MRPRRRGRRGTRARRRRRGIATPACWVTTTGAPSTWSPRWTATPPWRGPAATERSRRYGRRCRAPAFRDAGWTPSTRRRGGTVGAAAPARRRVTLVTWAALAAVAAAAGLISLGSGPPAGAATPPPYLLALGGSASVGFQPTLVHPRGQPTSAGYAEDLVPLEQQRWPGLNVVHLGCPGATTMTVLEGGGKCLYPEGSQLQAAEAFLRTHPTTALVTVDLGFNDLLSCLRHEVVDTPCVDEVARHRARPAHPDSGGDQGRRTPGRPRRRGRSLRPLSRGLSPGSRRRGLRGRRASR